MVTKVVADVVLRLSDSAIVPMDIINFVDLVRKGKQMLASYKSVFDSTGINLGKIKKKCSEADKVINSYIDTTVLRHYMYKQSKYQTAKNL